jgi:hypothetical protein
MQLRYYPSICLELRKTTQKPLCQDKPSLIQDFNLRLLQSDASIPLIYNVHTVAYKMVHVCAGPLKLYENPLSHSKILKNKGNR